MKRAVITGMGAITPLGTGVGATVRQLLAGAGATVVMPGWDRYQGLRSQVAAPAEIVDERQIPRKDRRSMGRLSLFAALAAREARDAAGLTPEILEGGRCGCVVGSTMGSAGRLTETFELMLPDHDLTKLTSMAFFQCVGHTAAMNVAQHLGLRGTVVAPAAACASGTQAVGIGLELIRRGEQDVVFCGGAEEVHPTVTGSFDILMCTSAGFHDRPGQTPRPFDADRDGLVCGEGGGILVLEELDHARRRGAPIVAEVCGYATCVSGSHVSQSDHATMVRCMQAALRDAGFGPEAVDYVNAHATATQHGDSEEAAAVADLFGDRVPVSSLKGHLGHTLGASGPIELIGVLGAAANGVVLPTRNLVTVAPDCQGPDHVLDMPREANVHLFLKNSFAFGGISAVLVCRPWQDERAWTVPA